MQSLIRLLAHSPSPVVQKRALFALSSLVRFFPYAQQRFLQLGGLSVLSALMRSEGADKLPIKVKGVTLLHDLLIEHVSRIINFYSIQHQYYNLQKRFVTYSLSFVLV